MIIMKSILLSIMKSILLIIMKSTLLSIMKTQTGVEFGKTVSAGWILGKPFLKD